jgi:hypothetical protein
MGKMLEGYRGESGGTLQCNYTTRSLILIGAAALSFLFLVVIIIFPDIIVEIFSNKYIYINIILCLGKYFKRGFKEH